MKYLNQTRKQLTLPSGATIEIRKANWYHPAFDKSEGNAIASFILTERVGLLQYEGESARIVNKTSESCAPGEIAIADLDQKDAQTIVDSVLEFSGFTTAKEAVKTFREESQAGDSASPDSAIIQVPADRIAKIIHG